jgi:hypothetical protein
MLNNARTDLVYHCIGGVSGVWGTLEDLVVPTGSIDVRSYGRGYIGGGWLGGISVEVSDGYKRNRREDTYGA